MKHLYILTLILSVILLTNCSQIPTNLYVSPLGNDKASGSLEEPLRSFQGARDRIRETNISEGNITVNFKGGIYPFENTVVLGQEDSGSPERKIVYKAMDGETPVFTSGKQLKNWTKIRTDDPVYEYLPEAARKEVFVAELPEPGQTVLHLSDRNSDWLSPAKINVTDYVITEKFIHGNSVEGQMWDPQEEKKYCRFSKSMEGLSNRDDAMIFSIYTADFELQVLPVESIERQILQTATPGGHRLALPEEGQQHGSRDLAFLHNLAEGINAPGLFASYPETGKIYLWPDGSTEEIYAPSLNELIRIEGVPHGSEAWFSNAVEDPVRNISFEGLGFSNCKYSIWLENDVFAQHHWAILDKDNAMLRLRGTENISITNCSFSKSGGAGIAMDLYAQKNKVENCRFEQLGHESVRFCGYGIGTKDENKNNSLIGSEIQRVNLNHAYGAAVVVWNSGFNTISNNYIHDVPSRAVLLSAPRCRAFTKNNQTLFPADRIMQEQAWTMARWDEVPDSALATVIMHPENYRWEEVNGIRELYKDRLSAHFRYLRGNLIEKNVIENAAMDLFADAIIYITSCATGEANKIIGNYFCNTGRELPEANIPFRLFYIDGFSGDFIIERNIIHNSRFKFEMIGPYSWWGKVKIAANLIHESESGDPWFGENEEKQDRFGFGNIFVDGDYDDARNEYLNDYLEIMNKLEAGDWNGPSPLPGSDLILDHLNTIIFDMK